MEHILAVEGTAYYNLDTGKMDYHSKITVSEDVLQWLNNHDIEMADNGSPIYICNKLRYLYLGPMSDSPHETIRLDGLGKAVVKGERNVRTLKSLMEHVAKLAEVPEEQVHIRNFRFDLTKDDDGDA